MPDRARRSQAQWLRGMVWLALPGRSKKMIEPTVRLALGRSSFEFTPAPLIFSDCRTGDLFSHKNNRTLHETIRHRKYVGLAPEALTDYAGLLDLGLGTFLLRLKEAGDPFYTRFLNPYGDLTYCEFRLPTPSMQRLKGVYCFTVCGELKYIGRCRDSFGKRINHGYGRIHPKNCYRDGQSTNCHLNALIAAVSADVRLHIHPMSDDTAINTTESALIATYNPSWNIQLRTSSDRLSTGDPVSDAIQ